MNDNDKLDSDNKIIYQLDLNNKSLGLVNPYLFIEKLRDEIMLKLPNVKVKISYNAKRNNEYLIQLKCFSFEVVSGYELNDIKEKIKFITNNLRNKLDERIREAKHSIA